MELWKGKILESRRPGKASETDESCARNTAARPKKAVSLAVLASAVLLGGAFVTLAFAVAGCGTTSTVGDAGTISTTGGTTTTESTTTTTEAPLQTTTTSTPVVSSTTTTLADNMMTVTVYYVRDEKIAASHRVILKTLEVGKTAMQELLFGPSGLESDAGMTSAIPAGTTFLGLDINSGTGVATVNLSKEYASGGGSLSMSLRLAQVVYTLTQFPTVTRVNFELDGKAVDVFGSEGIILNHPVGRADYEDVTPAILVESPTALDSVGSPVRITGTANTFEGTFIAQIDDQYGSLLGERTIAASSGTGQRGTFDVTIPCNIISPGNGSLIVYEESPKDGTQTNRVEIPLRLEK